MRWVLSTAYGDAEDAMRFQVEAVAHELRNPGWFKGWLARQGTPSSQAASGARVKPPMSPWMAFVRVSPCTRLQYYALPPSPMT